MHQPEAHTSPNPPVGEAGAGAAPARAPYGRATYWRTLQTFNATRVAIALVLLAYLSINSRQGFWVLESLLYVETCALYLALAIAFMVITAVWRRHFLSQMTAHLVADLGIITTLYVAAGGSKSGLAILYLFPLAGSAILAPMILALFFVSLVTLIMLFESGWRLLASATESTISVAGLYGAAFFAAVYVINRLAARLIRQERLAELHGQDLRIQLAINRLVIADMGDGILVVGADSTILTANPAAERLFGLRGLATGEGQARYKLTDIPLLMPIADAFFSWVDVQARARKNSRHQGWSEGGAGKPAAGGGVASTASTAAAAIAPAPASEPADASLVPAASAFAISPAEAAPFVADSKDGAPVSLPAATGSGTDGLAATADAGAVAGATVSSDNPAPFLDAAAAQAADAWASAVRIDNEAETLDAGAPPRATAAGAAAAPDLNAAPHAPVFVVIKPGDEMPAPGVPAGWGARRDLMLHLKLRFVSIVSAEVTAGRTVIFLRDVGEIENQAQQLKLASMGRLTASIAHEVRNPLSAISYAAGLLGEEGGNATHARLVSIVHENVARLNRMIEDILKLSRKAQSQEGPVRLATACAEIVDEFMHTHDVGAGVIRVGRLDAELVHFDPLHLREVIVNLLSNAYRYASKEQGSILLFGVSDVPGRLELHVKDDGAPITPQVRAHLFEPFYTTSSKGTGLGLYLARELCLNNNAMLDYEYRIDDFSGNAEETSGRFVISFAVNL